VQNRIKKEAIILAGGFGTRLKTLITEIPKPMAPIHNRPFIEYLLDYLQPQGITDVILSVGYANEAIRNHFGDNYGTLQIRYSKETYPLGTGGAIKSALSYVEQENVFILNGDTLFLINIEEQMTLHTASGADMTLALKPMKNFDRYGSVSLQDSRIVSFEEKQPREEGLISGGVYVFRRDVLNDLELSPPFSIEKDVFEPYVNSFYIAGFMSDADFVDIGTPGSYREAVKKLSGGTLNA
jgi:D-glycero-alpha-D-manno-heptose 1-phosphate guanylyltransferase